MRGWKTPGLSFLAPPTSTPLAPASTHLGLCAWPKFGTPGEGTPTVPGLATPQAGRPPPQARGTHLSSAAVEPVRRPKSALGLSHGQRRGVPAASGASFGAPRDRQARQGMRALTETRQWRRLAAARAPGTLQEGGSGAQSRGGEEQEEEQEQEEGTEEAGPSGERVGQRRIASAHCCPAGSGAALSRAGWACGAGCRPPADRSRTSRSGPAAQGLLGFSPGGGDRRGRGVGPVMGWVMLRSRRTWDILSTPSPLLGKVRSKLEPTSSLTLLPRRVPGAAPLPRASHSQFPSRQVTPLRCWRSLRRPGGQRSHPLELTPPPGPDASGQAGGASIGAGRLFLSAPARH